MKRFVVWLLFYTQLANAAQNQCAVDVQESLRGITTSNGPEIANVDYPVQLWKAHEDLALKIWNLFENDKALNLDIESCLIAPVNAASLNHALTQSFFKGSLKQIENINHEVYNRLNQKVDLSRIAFSAFAKCESCQKDFNLIIQGRSAQFNHMAQSILVNISKMQLADWNIVFIHELGHYVIPDSKWSKPFLAADTINNLQKFLKDKSDQSQLTIDEIQNIDEWLLNGINLKLLSEWRVWSFTLYYIEGQKDIVFGEQTAWLKHFHELPKGDKYKELFKALDSGFTDPEKGLESKPIILQRIAVLRQKLRQQVADGTLQPLDFLKY